jgi:hypothetical protein
LRTAAASVMLGRLLMLLDAPGTALPGDDACNKVGQAFQPDDPDPSGWEA